MAENDTTEIKSPKVFISYSWSSQEHQERVIELATKLCVDGVDVILDKWELKEGQDKFAFMEKMVLDPSISNVLMIVDKVYTEKANTRNGGVGTETQIISAELYSRADETKFIPIVLEHDDDGAILPTFLKTRIYIDFSPKSNVDHYQQLVRTLYGKPVHQKPPIGIPPKFIETTIIPVTPFLSNTYELKKVILSNATQNIAANAKKVYRDLAVEIKNHEIKTFQSNLHDEEVLASIHKLKIVQDTFIDITSQLIDHDPNHVLISIREYFEPLLKLYSPQTSGSYFEYQTDNIAFLAQESLLNLVALLIQSEHFHTFSVLTRTYLISKENSQRENVLITSLYRSIQSLETLRKRRLQLNRVSVTADLFKERSDNNKISFDDLISADLFLFLRGLFKSGYWAPRSAVFIGMYDKTDIFIRSESIEYFKKMLTAFDMYSPEEFKEKYNKIREVHGLSNWRISNDSWPLNFDSLINFKKLGTL